MNHTVPENFLLRLARKVSSIPPSNTTRVRKKRDTLLKHTVISHYRSPEEIQPDFTVQSGRQRLTRFPSDLLESSVDPPLKKQKQKHQHQQPLNQLPQPLEQPCKAEPASKSLDTVLPRDFQETTRTLSPEDMVRVYQPPAVSNAGRGHAGGQPLNGFQVPIHKIK